MGEERMTCQRWRVPEWEEESADEICLLNFARKVCFGESWSDVNVCQQHEQVPGLMPLKQKVHSRI